MKAADFERFPINKRRKHRPERYDAFVLGIDMEFNITSFMRTKETTTHADLYEETEQMQQRINTEVKQWRIAIG
jgi:hypothetical protein